MEALRFGDGGETGGEGGEHGRTDGSKLQNERGERDGGGGQIKGEEGAVVLLREKRRNLIHGGAREGSTLLDDRGYNGGQIIRSPAIATLLKQAGGRGAVENDGEG